MIMTKLSVPSVAQHTTLLLCGVIPASRSKLMFLIAFHWVLWRSKWGGNAADVAINAVGCVTECRFGGIQSRSE